MNPESETFDMICSDFDLKPIDKKKTYYTIIETILGMINTGTLVYGQKLYREDELAALLQVSRPTLREALRVLEFLGIITTRPRKGIIINDPSANENYPPLECILVFEKMSVRDIHELRCCIEAGMVDRIIERGTDEDLACLKESLDQLVLCNGKEDGFNQLHSRFHIQLCKCSHNYLSCRLLSSIFVLLNNQADEVFKVLPKQSFKKMNLHHNALYEAAQGRDRAAMQRAMAEHLYMAPYDRLFIVEPEGAAD